MRQETNRPSIYINSKLAEVRTRARYAGETLSGALTHMAHRYDMALSFVTPELPADQLMVLRRIFASHPCLPAVLIRPKTVAVLVEEAADSRRDDEETLRST